MYSYLFGCLLNKYFLAKAIIKFWESNDRTNKFLIICQETFSLDTSLPSDTYEDCHYELLNAFTGPPWNRENH